MNRYASKVGKEGISSGEILNNNQNQQHVFPFLRGKCTGLSLKKQMGGVKNVNDVHFMQNGGWVCTDIVQLCGYAGAFE